MNTFVSKRTRCKPHLFSDTDLIREEFQSVAEKNPTSPRVRSWIFLCGKRATTKRSSCAPAGAQQDLFSSRTWKRLTYLKSLKMISSACLKKIQLCTPGRAAGSFSETPLSSSLSSRCCINACCVHDLHNLAKICAT